MIKDDLKKLRKLKRELADLERRIRENDFEPKEPVADTAKDYRTGFGKTIVIRGYGDDGWAKLQDKYKRKRGQIAERVLELEKFLDGIKDPEMRQIFRMRYEDGMSQEEVGEAMGLTRQAIQKREERFWNGADGDDGHLST